MVMSRMGFEALSTSTAITVSGTTAPNAAGEPTGAVFALGTSCSVIGATSVKAHGAQSAAFTYASGAAASSYKSGPLGNLLSGSCDVTVQCNITPASGVEPIYMQIRDSAANNLYTFQHTNGGKLTLKAASNVVSTVNFDPSVLKSIRFSWVIDTATAANCKVRMAWYAVDSDTAVYDTGWITLAPAVLGNGVQFVYGGICNSIGASGTCYLDDVRTDPAQNDLIPYLGSLVCTSTQDKTTGSTPGTTDNITLATQFGNANAKSYSLLVEYSASGTFGDTVTSTLGPQAGVNFTVTPASGQEGSYRLTGKATQSAI